MRVEPPSASRRARANLVQESQQRPVRQYTVHTVQERVRGGARTVHIPTLHEQKKSHETMRLERCLLFFLQVGLDLSKTTRAG